MGDFEDWEADYELINNEDWKGLVKWRKSKYDKNPKEHYNQFYYGDALVKNGEFYKAIEILTEAYNQYPESTDIIHCLLNALFKSGKTEKDFQWKSEPKILSLDNETLELSRKYLKHKRQHRSVYDIYYDLFMAEVYLNFTENELIQTIVPNKKKRR